METDTEAVRVGTGTRWSRVNHVTDLVSHGVGCKLGDGHLGVLQGVERHVGVGQRGGVGKGGVRRPARRRMDSGDERVHGGGVGCKRLENVRLLQVALVRVVVTDVVGVVGVANVSVVALPPAPALAAAVVVRLVRLSVDLFRRRMQVHVI